VPKPLILGLSGPVLAEAEGAFFADADPLGFILFARNCETPGQLAALTADLRGAVSRADAPILIDQEGGRVARLGPPHWRVAPPAVLFGRLASADMDAARHAVTLNSRLIGAELAGLGINVDCAPVLDLPTGNADPIIGDRAFGHDPDLAATLGAAFCDGLEAAGVLPVVKHIPGHGRAAVDSHRELPRIDESFDDLAARDFAPFRVLAARRQPTPWAMTAHVVYTAIDPEFPATLSSRVIADVIRGDIGFDGVLISDDLSMGALAGPMGERADRALRAGCDLVLHCDGEMADMVEIARAMPEIGVAASERIAGSLGALGMRSESGNADFNRSAASSELDRLLGRLKEGTQ
jgi:beta-N-acetylhexosaminidase